MGKYEVNPAFIGIDNLGNVQNAMDIVHPVLIDKYELPQGLNSVKKHGKPNGFLGIDIETKDNKAELIAIVDYNIDTKEHKKSYILGRKKDGVEGMLTGLAKYVNFCLDDNRLMSAWSNYDAVHILKLMLEFNGSKHDDIMNSCKRYSKKIGGYYSKGTWITKPVVMVKLQWKNSLFGIMKAMNGAIQFFIQTETMERPKTVWMIDIKVFFHDTLEKTCKKYQKEIKFKYNKFGKEYHKIDWEKFYKDKDYADVCVRSCVSDAYAAKQLALFIQRLIFETLGFYPSTMISAGSLVNLTLASKLSEEDNDAVNFYLRLKEWRENGTSQKELKQLYNIIMDSYSAGLIEILKQGYFETVGFFDITNSYPAIISSLLDLRGSTITTGKNVKFKDLPTPNGKNYIFVTMEMGFYKDYLHTLLVKTNNPQNEFEETTGDKTNARYMGDIITNGLYHEYMVVFSQMDKREKENFLNSNVIEYVEIQTTGQLAPISYLSHELFNTRISKMGTPQEKIIKDIMSSMYGKMYECYPNFIEYIEDEPVLAGKTAGRYFNPLYASIITAFARIRLVEAALHIQKNGGDIIVLMTDAIYFNRKNRDAGEFLPKKFESILSCYQGLEYNGWSDKKELGMFHTPHNYTNGTFLKTGVYEFQNEEGIYEVKSMGFFVERSEEAKKFSFYQPKLEKGYQDNLYTDDGTPYIIINRNVFITPSMICDDNMDYDAELLGHIIEGREEKMELWNFNGKREYEDQDERPQHENFLDDIISTRQIVFFGAFEPYESRLVQCRKLFTFDAVAEGERKKINTSDRIKILCKQIKDELGLNIPQKSRDATNTMTGQKLGPKGLREILLSNGKHPLI